jgi:hypothetical protein
MNSIVLIIFYKEYVYALLYCKGLKPTCDIRTWCFMVPLTRMAWVFYGFMNHGEWHMEMEHGWKYT